MNYLLLLTTTINEVEYVYNLFIDGTIEIKYTTETQNVIEVTNLEKLFQISKTPIQTIENSEIKIVNTEGLRILKDDILIPFSEFTEQTNATVFNSFKNELPKFNN